MMKRLSFSKWLLENKKTNMSMYDKIVDFLFSCEYDDFESKKLDGVLTWHDMLSLYAMSSNSNSAEKSISLVKNATKVFGKPAPYVLYRGTNENDIDCIVKSGRLPSERSYSFTHDFEVAKEFVEELKKN